MATLHRQVPAPLYLVAGPDYFVSLTRFGAILGGSKSETIWLTVSGVCWTQLWHVKQLWFGCRQNDSIVVLAASSEPRCSSAPPDGTPPFVHRLETRV